MTRIRPVPFCILLAGLFGLCSASAGAATSAAFLDADRSPLGAVLESKLLASSALTWIEIADLGNVLKEQDLQAAFSPEALKLRVSIGLLAKTDLLVLLRSIAPKPAEKGSNLPPPAKQLDLVICETRYGMRLGAHSVPEGKSLEEQAAQLKQLVDQAIERFSRQRAETCAVLAFTNRNESLREDYLRFAYAELLKQTLLDYTDLALVEPLEAAALAREFSQADAKARPVRRLPLAFVGEYRRSPGKEAKTIDVKLSLSRGDQQIGEVDQKELSPESVPDFLRRSAGSLLAKVSIAAPPNQVPAIAARQLAERSRELQRLGNWEDALALLEASLFFQPEQRDVRHDAIMVSRQLAWPFYSRSKDLQVVLSSLQYFRRGGEHVEIFLQATPDLKPHTNAIGLNFIFFYPFSIMHQPAPSQDEAKPEYERVVQETRELLLRLTAIRAQQESDDDARFLANLLPVYIPVEQRFKVISQVVLELQDLPRARQRTGRFAKCGRSVTILNNPSGQDFLRQLAASQNPNLNAAAEDLRQELVAYLKDPPQIIERPEPESVIPFSTNELTFRPLTLKTESGQRFNYEGCFPAGDGVDVVWGHNRLALMKRPGELKIVWTGKNLNDRVVGFAGDTSYRARNIAFDGRYVWAAAWRFHDSPLMLVLDPVNEKVWEITAEDGLPVVPPEQVTEGARRQYLAVAAVESGKACIVGSFGRTWFAMVTFRGDERPLVEVFHECLETADRLSLEQWKKTTVAFDPTYMIPVNDPVTSERRIILGRWNNTSALPLHPLVIDPVRRTVKVLEDEMPSVHMHDCFAIYNSELHVLHYGHFQPQVYRFSWPKLTRESFLQKVPTGTIYFHRGEFHIVGEKWWCYNPTDKTLRVASESVPWWYYRRTSQPPPDLSQLDSIHFSNHFGLLAATSRYDARGRALYQVDFSPSQRDTKAAPR